MKEKVERLAKGDFEYELPELLVSEETLSISVCAGEAFCGKFSVYNRDLTLMKGVVYSSCEFLTVADEQFIGRENEISYEVNARYAKAGETFRGEITVVSDCGEISLPFSIRILPMSCMSCEGEIRDLFQFAGLAQNNWAEARRVFFLPAFQAAVLADRVGMQSVYQQLIRSTSQDNALEEFLVYSKKKSFVQIKTDRLSIDFCPEKKAVMERIAIWKDTWGYVDIAVETVGDFFMVSAKHISMEQWGSGRYELEVAVDGESLAEGRHFGQIILKTARQQIFIDIRCVCEKTAREQQKKRRLFLEAERKIYEKYFDFRTGRTTPTSYMTETDSMVELLLVRLRESVFPEAVTDKKELLYRMYRAYLALIGGRQKRAEAEIEGLRAKREQGWTDQELVGTLYYLEAMLQRNAEGVRHYAEQIGMLAKQFPESGLLLWFYLYTDKRRENGRSMHLARIKEQFLLGQRSPFLYYEALLLWNEEPALIKELGEFEQQVLNFALKRQILKKETMLQCALLAPQAKKQGMLLIRCFLRAYELFGQRDVLQVICTLLIANDMRAEKYHKYFADGCAAQIRLEKLQEYYIYTCGCSMKQPLDQSVLLYFIYGNQLEEPYRAFLYAYVVHNKNSMSSFYRTYSKRIEQYAISSMKEGRIDKNLAIVYAEVLRADMIDAQLAQVLPDLLFTYCMECENDKMTAVSVLHKEEESDTVLPFVGRMAYFKVYTEDAGILLLDDAGNRYLPAGITRMYRLWHAEELLARCYELACENRVLLLNLMDKVHNYRTVDIDAIELCRRVVALDGLRESFRQGELRVLVKYCYDNYHAELLDSYLAKLKPEYLDKNDRCQMIELFIVRGRYDLAMEEVNKYGMDGITPKRLLKLCDRMLLQCGEEEPNDMLLPLCMEVFRKDQYNERIVRYLASYYNGTTQDMFHIWQACEENEISAEVLEERLLGQHLFTETFLSDGQGVFFSYLKKKANPKLIRAYLSFYAYRYFVRGMELSPKLYSLLLREAEENNTICRLAMLKTYAEKDVLTGEELAFVRKSLEMLSRQDMCFPFFKAFEGKAELPPGMADKQYVEYHTRPDRKVKISYLYDNEENTDFVCEEMRHIGYGFFVKDFILFYEEELQYYITEEKENGRAITESFFRRADSDMPNDETTKYGQINLILTAMDLQDEKTTIDMLENYYRMEYTVNRLFSPIKE